MKLDRRVDTYIAKAPAFAQPILAEARKRVQKTLPGVEETIKWNVPFFLLSGKILASMAAFKKHVKVGVWVGSVATFQDVASVAELTSAPDFAAQLRAAADGSDQAMKSRSEGGAKPSTTMKASAKKVGSKEAATKKPPAKQAVTKKARGKGPT